MNRNRKIILISLLLLIFISCKLYHSSSNENSNFLIKKQISNFESKKNFYFLNKNYLLVKTDVLLFQINIKKGDIEKVFILNFKNKLGENKPYQLLNNLNENFYQAKNQILFLNNKKNYLFNNLNFKLLKPKKIINDNKSEFLIILTCKSPNGIIYKKIFNFSKHEYYVNISFLIKNNSNKNINIIHNVQLIKSILENKNKINNNYKIATYIPNIKKYFLYNFKKIKKSKINIFSKNGWIAIFEKYFLTSSILYKSDKYKFYSHIINNQKLIIGFKSIPIKIKQNNQKYFESILFLGPRISEKMLNIKYNFKLISNSGYLSKINSLLLNSLKFINNYINNWGISIILLTLIFRMLIYPLTKHQNMNIVKMKILQKKIIDISNRFGTNKEKYNNEIKNLYKQENINPISGILLLIIQIPILFAFYNVLLNSIELRYASFIGWIKDLSMPDPYYILPIILGISFLYIQNISYENENNKIKILINNLLSVIFIIIFLYLPSGLILYYLTSNIITIIQQKFLFNFN